MPEKEAKKTELELLVRVDAGLTLRVYRPLRIGEVTSLAKWFENGTARPSSGVARPGSRD